MRALGSPRVTMKMWKDWYFAFKKRGSRNTSAAIANFKRGDKKRARREGRVEVQMQFGEIHKELSDMTLAELRALAVSMPALSVELATELHFRLWDWLVKNAHTLPGKSDWPGWDGTPDAETNVVRFGGHKIWQACFLCYMQCNAHGKSRRNCTLCPMHLLSLKGGYVYCDAYHQWLNACLDRNPPLAACWAARIRDCVKRG